MNADARLDAPPYSTSALSLRCHSQIATYDIALDRILGGRLGGQKRGGEHADNKEGS